MSLSKARDRAVATLAAVADDKDPAADKKQERARAQRARLDTLSVLADRYSPRPSRADTDTAGVPRRKSTLALEAYYWTRHIDPSFGRRAIRTITRAEIQTFVNDFDAPSTARQCRVVFQRLFTYARWLELVEIDPSRFVQVDDFKPRDRVQRTKS